MHTSVENKFLKKKSILARRSTQYGNNFLMEIFCAVNYLTNYSRSTFLCSFSIRLLSNIFRMMKFSQYFEAIWQNLRLVSRLKNNNNRTFKVVLLPSLCRFNVLMDFRKQVNLIEEMNKKEEECSQRMEGYPGSSSLNRTPPIRPQQRLLPVLRSNYTKVELLNVS